MSVLETTPRTVRRRRLLRYGLAALIVIGLIIAIGPRSRTGAPLDPRSTDPLGTRGIIEVLQRLGTTVEVDGGAPGADDGVALVIDDGLSDQQRDDLDAFVDQGGRLVLADPFSPLAPDLTGLTSIAFTEPTIEPDCDDPSVSGVGRVAVSGGTVFSLPPGSVGCFPRNGGFWLVRTPQGRGETITIGGQFTLTNDLLGTEDTAVLLVNLLTPAQGQDLRVVTGDVPASAEPDLTDLLPDQVGYALWQIPLAWLALVWWRGRRHGKQVEENAPIRIEAAETTVAVGNLLYNAGRATDAAAIIRARVNRELTRRLGLPPLADQQTFIAIATQRTDLDAETLRRLLLQPLPTDDAGLVAFARTAAQTVDQIRQRRTADPNQGSTAASTPSKVTIS